MARTNTNTGGGGGGGITSIELIMPASFNVFGSPVVTPGGAFNVSLATGYVIPTQALLDTFLTDITDYILPGVGVTLAGMGTFADPYVINTDAAVVLLGPSGNTLYTPVIGAGSGELMVGNNIFLGPNTGSGADNVFNGIFFGSDAGLNALDAPNSVFIGGDSGSGATNAESSVFVGSGAGFQGVNVQHAVFVGDSAGSSAPDGIFGVFLGSAAGLSATTAYGSVFIGRFAGAQAADASGSVFIGREAGINDPVDNVTGDSWSILIGKYTSTGGYSGSIALGGYAINTAEREFLVGSAVELDGAIYQMKLGVNDTATDGMIYSIQDLGTVIYDGVYSDKVYTSNFRTDTPGNASADTQTMSVVFPLGDSLITISNPHIYEETIILYSLRTVDGSMTSLVPFYVSPGEVQLIPDNIPSGDVRIDLLFINNDLIL